MKQYRARPASELEGVVSQTLVSDSTGPSAGGFRVLLVAFNSRGKCVGVGDKLTVQLSDGVTVEEYVPKAEYDKLRKTREV